MKRLFLFLIVCVCAENAHAQQIRDWSLPMDQSLQQPNISGGAPNNYGSYLGNRNIPSPPPPPIEMPAGANAGPAPTDPYSTGPSRHFMEGYCDPNFKPAVSNACIEAQKRQTCYTYQQLPGDAQALVNKITGCDFNTESGLPNDPACDGNDAIRLRLLKKYESDPSTVHALIDLPDAVLHAAENCTRGAR